MIFGSSWKVRGRAIVGCKKSMDLFKSAVVNVYD